MSGSGREEALLSVKGLLDETCNKLLEQSASVDSGLFVAIFVDKLNADAMSQRSACNNKSSLIYRTKKKKNTKRVDLLKSVVEDVVASNTDRVVVPHRLKHVDVSGAAASTTLKQEHTLLERDHEGRVFEQLQQEKLSFLILLFLIFTIKKGKSIQ